MLRVTSRLVRVDGLLQSRVGDDLVMINPDLGRYFGLNPVASFLWSEASEPRTVAELRDAVCREFAVTPEQCEADILVFAQVMIDRGLMRVVG